jgi:hypothetical protein
MIPLVLFDLGDKDFLVNINRELERSAIGPYEAEIFSLRKAKRARGFEG